MNHTRNDTTVAWYRRPSVLSLLAIGGFVAVYLAVQNWEQTAPYLPWLLILAMPLMHVFMHRGHGAHGANGGMGGRGGHGNHGGEHRHGQSKDAGHDGAPNAPAALAEATRDDQSQRGGCCGGQGTPEESRHEAGPSEPAGGCCGGGSNALGDRDDAPMHAQGGGCCGGAGDEAAEQPDDQPPTRLERR